MQDLFVPRKIEATPLADQVSSQLIDWIMDGNLVMGQKLNTEELAKQLGVSRMPIREAIKHLEKLGIVESIPYVGSSLVTLNREEVEQIYLMRASLEPIAAKAACEKATDEQISTIRAIHEFFTEQIETGELTAKEIFVLNRKFHFSIYNASGLNRVNDIIEILWSNLAFYKLIYGQNYVKNKESSKEMLAEHSLYVEFLENRKGEDFAEVLKANLCKNREKISMNIESVFQ